MSQVTRGTFLARDAPISLVTGPGAINDLPSAIARVKADRAIIFYDAGIPHSHLADCIAQVGPIPSIELRVDGRGESIKSLTSIVGLLARIEHFATSDSVIISLGGGTISNAAGMVAALIFRGVSLIHIPTTLMAQADAAIGLKQAVNSQRAKNIYGLYHQPATILNDIGFLATLHPSQFREGFAEIAKLAVAVGSEVLDILLRKASPASPTILPIDELSSVIHQTAATKLAGLATDPYETSNLSLFELGHVAAHAIEAASRFKIHHGTAVAMGMLVEATYSAATQHADGQLVDLLEYLLIDRLDIAMERWPSASSFEAALAWSNKRTRDGLMLTLPIAIGKTAVRYLPDPSVLAEFYDIVARRLGEGLA